MVVSMEKNEIIFDLRNIDKKKIDSNDIGEKLFINPREIRYTKMGINI